MDRKELAEKLGNLIQLNVDAVHAYEQAIERIDVTLVRERLREFQADHERHIEVLSIHVRQIGEVPPERSRDLKGFLIEGFTAIRSMTGTEGALKAMESNEETTNKHYSEALSCDLPPDSRSIVERNYADERRHLAYVREALSTRVWEKAA